MLRDFNYIQNDVERIGGTPRLSITMQKFNQFIDNYGFLELSNYRGSMSWTNGQTERNSKWTKLDQALAS